MSETIHILAGNLPATLRRRRAPGVLLLVAALVWSPPRRGLGIRSGWR